jgi:hypothetical protein
MRNNNNDRIDDDKRSAGRTSNEPPIDRGDITDPERDREKLRGDEATIELPDVKDIPGQEFVHAPVMSAFADTTISSADEEGEGLFEEDETTIVEGTDADISASDKRMLETADQYIPTKDEASLHEAELDETDSDGDSLNEDSEDLSGSDLDIPESEDVAHSDRSGQGDEENRYFSLGGDDNEANETRS